MSDSKQNAAQGLTRRQFVAAGATGAMALGARAEAAEKNEKPAAKGPSTPLPTRTLGKTGLKVSQIAYGSYNLSNPRLLDAAIDAGVTLVLTCNDYQNGRAEKTIGEVMKRRRKQVVLGTGKKCSRDISARELSARIDESLKRLQTDHLDLWRVHFVDDPKVLDNDAIYTAFDKAKKAGKVGHLGVSTHTAPNTWALVNAAIGTKRFEFVMGKYNFMEFPKDYVPYAKAVQAGMGVVVFKVYAGARDKASKEMQRIRAKLKISAEQAKIRWALQNENVTSVISGERSFQGIKEACQALTKKLSQAERRYLDAYARRFQHEYCRFCGQCRAACPHGVRVDDVMRFAMYFKYYGAEKAAMQEYAALPADARAAACATCDAPCMKVCPHGVRVWPQLVEAHDLLSLDTGSDRYA